jgi:hypothetical protein
MRARADDSRATTGRLGAAVRPVEGHALRRPAMRGSTRPRPTPAEVSPTVNAVVWIEPGRALVVRGGDPQPSPVEVPIPITPTAAAPALAQVARLVGPVGHVLVLGSSDLRTALEREIVALGHRPEVICEAVVEGPVDDATLIGRLRALA